MCYTPRMSRTSGSGKNSGTDKSGDHTFAPQKKRFIELLASTGNVTEAARLIGTSRRNVYEHKKRDKEFAAAWDDALERGCDALEAEARRRAAQGVDKPVFYKGEVVGKVREYSDLLLIFLLKAYRPEKFREKVDIGGRIEHDVTEKFAHAVSRVPPEYQKFISSLTEAQRKEFVDVQIKH